MVPIFIVGYKLIVLAKGKTVFSALAYFES